MKTRCKIALGIGVVAACAAVAHSSDTSALAMEATHEGASRAIVSPAAVTKSKAAPAARAPLPETCESIVAHVARELARGDAIDDDDANDLATAARSAAVKSGEGKTCATRIHRTIADA